MKIPPKILLVIFLVALFGSSGVYMILLAKQKEAAMRGDGTEDSAAIVLGGDGRADALSVIARAPDFEYTDALGKAFSSESLKGKIYLADFFFTSCPGICPTMMENTAKLAKEFAGEPVEFVCFSVDPETDTPERMKAYGDKYGADPAVWHLLTGPMEETARLSFDGFKVGTLEAPSDHSARMALVDHNGDIRGYFSAINNLEQEALIAAVRQLLGEMK